MSVYIHKKSADGLYSFDHQICGRRFSGSTGKTNRRDAEQEEKRLKEEHRGAIEAEKCLTGPRLTIEQGCARYWWEKKTDFAQPGDLLRYLEWLKDHFGAQTMLSDIDDNRVARMVAARRGEFAKNKKIKKLVSKATVNRTAIEPLQRMMNRARTVWKADTQVIDWRSHVLAEPQERVREASVAEEEAILSKLERGYDVAIRFALRMGARRMEILNLDWTDVSFPSKTMTLKGKGDKSRVVPIPPDMYDLLWAEKDHHPVKVFTYVAARASIMADGRRLVRGQRYPLTKRGFTSAFERAVPKAGVTNYRLHDNRHTAATRLLRQTGNLRLVQRLLGHSDIHTTAKYAHTTIDDLAAAMALMAPGNGMAAESPGKTPGNSGTKAASD